MKKIRTYTGSRSYSVRHCEITKKPASSETGFFINTIFQPIPQEVLTELLLCGSYIKDKKSISCNALTSIRNTLEIDLCILLYELAGRFLSILFLSVKKPINNREDQ